MISGAIQDGIRERTKNEFKMPLVLVQAAIFTEYGGKNVGSDSRRQAGQYL